MTTAVKVAQELNKRFELHPPIDIELEDEELNKVLLDDVGTQIMSGDVLSRASFDYLVDLGVEIPKGVTVLEDESVINKSEESPKPIKRRGRKKKVVEQVIEELEEQEQASESTNGKTDMEVHVESQDEGENEVEEAPAKAIRRSRTVKQDETRGKVRVEGVIPVIKSKKPMLSTSPVTIKVNIDEETIMELVRQEISSVIIDIIDADEVYKAIQNELPKLLLEKLISGQSEKTPHAVQKQAKSSSSKKSSKPTRGKSIAKARAKSKPVIKSKKSTKSTKPTKSTKQTKSTKSKEGTKIETTSFGSRMGTKASRIDQFMLKLKESGKKMTRKAIAEKLKLSPQLVDNHIRNLITKGHLTKNDIG